MGYSYEQNQGRLGNVYPMKKHNKRFAMQNYMRCNLCGHRFHTRTKFSRFCKKCRRESELYRYHEWLPANAA